jgi:hypothetical protein
MKVTERDIFNFIFYPQSVRKEIKAFLSSIQDTSEAVIFYKELKSGLAQRPPVSLRKKIAKKISAYTFENKINLYPLHEPLHKRKPEHLVLAAASEKNSVPKLVTKTFVDDGKDYLIKLLTYGKNSKIFVFSTQDEILKDFDIVISPQNLRFHLNDNTEPLKIDQSIDPEQITIEF